MRRLLILAALCLSGLAGPSAAQDGAAAVHDLVRDSLLHLTASGQVQHQREPVLTQGTGFFVNDQGYALTTAHLLNEQQRKGAINVTLTARIADSGADPLDAAVIARLPELDLMLLRVLIPAGQGAALPLQTGSADMLRRGTIPPLLTSGFFGDRYRKLDAELNDTEGRDVAYAWTVNVETHDGQSGSPVYYLDGDTVRVIGLLKSTAGGTSTFAQMIPIDHAMPLIGHFRMDRLEAEIRALRQEVARLRGEVGSGTASGGGQPTPLFPRIEKIEPVVTQVSQHISWQPELQDGALRIVGRKLVRDSEIPPQVNYLVTPTVTYGPTTATRAPMDDELGTPRIASDQLTLSYIDSDFESRLAQHIQRKMGIPPGDSFTIDSLEFAISLPQTGADAAEKFRVTLGRRVVAE